MPANGPPTRNHPRTRGHMRQPQQHPPSQRHRSKINNEIPQYRLTHILLRWCLYDGQCHPFSQVEGVARTRWPSDL